jgi:hypothetical protein
MNTEFRALPSVAINPDKFQQLLRFSERLKGARRTHARKLMCESCMRGKHHGCRDCGCICHEN